MGKVVYVKEVARFFTEYNFFIFTEIPKKTNLLCRDLNYIITEFTFFSNSYIEVRCGKYSYAAFCQSFGQLKCFNSFKINIRTNFFNIFDFFKLSEVNIDSYVDDCVVSGQEKVEICFVRKLNFIWHNNCKQRTVIIIFKLENCKFYFVFFLIFFIFFLLKLLTLLFLITLCLSQNSAKICVL